MPRGVYKHNPITSEHRRRLSQIARNKGFGLWMLGKKDSVEARANKSAAQLRRHVLDNRISAARLRILRRSKRAEAVAKLRDARAETLRLIRTLRKSRLRPTPTVVCAFCGISFQQPRRVGLKPVRKFCSRYCAGRSRKGQFAGNWRGGRGSERHIAMSRVEYKQWRQAVFRRDNYSCQECGARGIRLQADHIRPWSVFPELRYQIGNGRTLCILCHRTITRRQMEETRRCRLDLVASA